MSDVIITGAGGFVAKNLRKSLQDFKITSLSTKKLQPMPGETVITTNYTDMPKMSCDVLVHLVGVGDSHLHQTNVSILDAVLHAITPKQIIFLSGLGVSPKNTSPYFESKYRAEQLVKSSGIPYTIFRPSFIVGSDDYLTRLLRSQNHTILVPGDGKYILQPISIQDVVSIIRHSFMNEKFFNKTFDLVGPDKLTFIQYVSMLSNTPVVCVPLETCLRRAIHGDLAYTLDDLCIFYGGFIGDFNTLQQAFGKTISHVKPA